LQGLLRRAKKKEQEQQLYSMWLTYFTAAQITGTKPMSFEEMLQNMRDDDAPSGRASTTKSPEQIYSEAMAAVERYEKSTNGKGGDA